MSKEIGERIRKRRELIEMSQEELAKLVGYKSRSSINKIELGENDLPQSKIKTISKALKTTPAYIMGWDFDEPAEKLTSDKFLWECFLRMLMYPQVKAKLPITDFESHSYKSMYGSLKDLSDIIFLKDSGDVELAQERFLNSDNFLKSFFFEYFEFDYQTLYFDLVVFSESQQKNNRFSLLPSELYESKYEYIDGQLGRSKLNFLLSKKLGSHIFQVDITFIEPLIDKLIELTDSEMRKHFQSNNQLLDYEMLYAALVEGDYKKANRYSSLIKDKIAQKERIEELEKELELLKEVSNS